MKINRAQTSQKSSMRDWHIIPEHDLLKKLRSSQEGLTDVDVRKRQKEFGMNSFKEHVHLTGLWLFLKHFNSPLILILVIAAFISIYLDQWHDSLIILAIILASAFIGYRQEFNAQEAIEKLKERIAHRSTVRRDGKESEIYSSEIVPGDIVLLKAGSMIPADGRILKARDLHVNESALTGESFPVEKSPGIVQPNVPITLMNNAVFMGTSVRSGTAEIVIIATGSNTRFGKIAHKLTFKRPATSFETGVKHFGFLLTRITFVLVILVFMTNVFVDRTTVESLLFAVALAVGIAPELLPAIIAVTLSKGARRMAEHGVIVRHLNAIENLGAMDVLCTDKTGTLTEDKIRLLKATNSNGKENYGVLMMACINAFYETGMKNPLDAALMERSEIADLKFANIQKVDEIPYDFIRKRLTIAVDDGTGIRLISKGAFRQILEICTWVDTGDNITELTTPQKEQLRSKFKSWGNKGYRVLGVADRSYDGKPEDGLPRFTKDEEHSFTFRGFLLFSDTPKINIQTTLQNLLKLGPEVKILTGDNRYVTRHLANNLGLNHKAILTGKELDKMRDDALFRRVNDIVVFAEMDPNQKERIIRALRRNDKVVGYLGDGINDVNAMREADISLSVDSAVDVAKATADMVLLEKDLSVMKNGIEEGRITFANTLKYILTTSSANFGNMISMAMASAFLGFLPLLPKQILLNNFLSDLPLLAIATDRVDTETMQRPQKWDVRFIRNFMILFGLISTLFDLITFGILIFFFHSGPDQFHTGWFLVSLLTEIGIIFVFRTRKSAFTSRPSHWLVITSVATLIATIILIYLPIYEITGFVPIGGFLFLTMVLISLGYLWVTELCKKHFYGLLEGKNTF